jgi:hypothetical protein
MTLTLSLDGGPATSLHDLGIGEATLVQDHLGQDTLTLVVPGPADTPPLLPPFGFCLLRVDDTIRFCGWLDDAPRHLSGTAEARAYTLTGPMRWLSRHTPATLWAGLGGLRRVGAGIAEDSAPQPLDTALRTLLDDVLDRFPSTLAYASDDLDIPALQHQIPVQRRNDNDAHTLLRYLLGYAPQIEIRWDYASGLPTLRCLDVLGGSTVGDLSETGYLLEAASLHPRLDLLADTVQIRWLRDDQLVRTDTVGPGGQAAALGADRTYHLTLTSDTRYILPAAGLAETLAAYRQTLHTDASATLRDLHWDHRPGDRWTLSGALSGALADPTTQPVCTTVSRALLTSIQTLTLGVPPDYALVPLGQRESNSDQDSPDETDTATITRTIEDPESDDIPDAYYIVNGQAYSSGSSATVPADTEITISYIVPADYVAPDDETVTLDPDATDTATVTAIWRSRLRLRRADGGDGEDIDINVVDIPEDKGTVKIIEYYVVINGALKQSLFLGSETPYDP